MPQTTVQKSDALRFGSAKLEIGADVASLSDVGAIRDLVFNHKAETVTIEFDNVEDIRFFKNGQRASFTFLLAEVDLSVLAQLESGMISNTNTAGTPVAGATQAITGSSYDFNEFIEIENQNGDGTVPTVNSLTGSTDGALTEDTDFATVQAADGTWGLIIIDSVAVTTMSQTFTLDYDYTPNASRSLSFTDYGQKTEFVARITNTNSDSETFIITLTGVTNITPLSLPFLSDEGDDVATIEVELEGTISSVVDQQSVT